MRKTWANLSLSTVLYLNVSAELVFEQITDFQCRKGAGDVLAMKISYSSCLDECKARDTCTGVSYRHTPPGCIAHTADAEVGDQTKCAHYVYSEKAKWTEKILLCESPRCNLPRTTCKGLTGQCRYKDCENQITADNMKVYGNLRSMGVKRSLLCSVKHRSNIVKPLVCSNNGKWRGTYPDCGAMTTASSTTTGYPVAMDVMKWNTVG